MINQLFRMPPHDAPTPESPRRSESNWAVIGGVVVASLLIVGIIGALVWVGFLQRASPSDASGPQYLTASVGQSITISSVKVTLTSAKVLVGDQTPTYEQVTPSGEPGQVIQGVAFSLHFQNSDRYESKRFAGTLAVLRWRWQFLPDHLSEQCQSRLQPRAERDTRCAIHRSHGYWWPQPLYVDYGCHETKRGYTRLVVCWLSHPAYPSTGAAVVR